MNAANPAARTLLFYASGTRSTRVFAGSCFLLIAFIGAHGTLRAGDGLALVPEFEVLHTAGGEKLSRMTLTVPNQQHAIDQARLQELVIAGASQRAQARRFTQRFLPEIEFARPSQSTGQGENRTSKSDCASEQVEIRLCASPDRHVEPRSPADAELFSYFQQDVPRPRAGGSIRGSNQGAQVKQAGDDLQSPPVRALGVGIQLPGGGPLPPDMTDWRGKPYCECPDCPRLWGGTCYCFCATCLCYNPLYFEEINLERYGYGCHDCLQPFCSAAHFFSRVPLLPCMMLRDPPCECNYTLGHYRPGSCNPWRPVGCCRL